MTTPDDNSNSISGIAATVGRYVKLLVEDARLNAAEKLTRMFSAIALCSLLTIVGIAAMVFISLAAGIALTSVMEPIWAFVIVAGVYILALVLLVVFRTQLLVNPIARFVSRLLLPAPPKTETNDKSAPVSK